ncbi:hypothetical protein CAEBREN_11575 [Caenorhabditis brenneri]|uniref:C-type lectin domain-containing protein n=1 Tax=Caenorhabditis brenneri TaxID=135651 RepID=G0NSZ2_CAEBE|nr:hypothetical protein CAEBREN_11575 [Caenorhabditis brenneri]
MKVWILILLFLSSTLAIIVQGEGKGGGGHHGSASSSEASSSEEHGHGHGHGNGHGHGPRPPRPPRPTPAPRNECDAGWMRFERPNGIIWCIFLGVPNITNGAYSQHDAQVACVAIGATLTGYQNDNERMTVANEALKRLTSMGGQVAGLWLGNTNNDGCRVASCGPFTTFRWIDGYTTGVAGFKWGVGEPDGNDWPGTTACAQQFIISPNFVAGPNDYASWKTHFVNGDLDKYQCAYYPAYPFTRFYACGKLGVKK